MVRLSSYQPRKYSANSVRNLALTRATCNRFQATRASLLASATAAVGVAALGHTAEATDGPGAEVDAVDLPPPPYDEVDVLAPCEQGRPACGPRDIGENIPGRRGPI